MSEVLPSPGSEAFTWRLDSARPVGGLSVRVQARGETQRGRLRLADTCYVKVGLQVGFGALGPSLQG